MRITLLSLVFFLTSFSTFAQITGKVTDTNGNTLSTVNIYIENTFIGTTTNDDGLYQLDITDAKTYTVIFKYLGFKTETRTVAITTFPYELNVELHEEKFTLDEVVISAEENPANAIIRNAIANRKTMLEKLETYKADFYSRGLIRIKDAPEKIFGQDVGDLGGGLDSTRSGIIYLSETISKIEYKKSEGLKEKIVASKVSGDDNGFSFNNASDVNFNFYKNTFELGSQIVSPISDFAFNYYRYSLEGVNYDDKGNLINKIKITPKRENDKAFSGHIYIVEDQWTIYAVEVTLTGQQADIPPVDLFTLRQEFSYSDDQDVWAPISQTFDFKYGILGIKGDGRFTAVFSNYNFKPEFTKNTFTKEILSFENEANKKDSMYWETKRPVLLTLEESEDYVKKDSIQIVRKSKTYLDSIDAKNNAFKITNLLTGYSYQNSYKEEYFNISGPLGKVSFNTVQGFNNNVTASYRKNYDEFRKYLSVTGSIGYGLEDRRLRGEGSITYKFNNITRPFLTLSGGVQARQFNANAPISPLVNSISTLFFEDNYLKIYDRSFAQLDFSQELFNGFHLFTNTSYERRKALFNTTDYTILNEKNDVYTSNNPLNEAAYSVAPFETHNIAKLNVTTRIRFGQKYLSYPKSRFRVTNRDYPTVYLSYEKGFAASNSDYNFDQVKLRLAQSIMASNKGTFRYNLKAGTFFNADAIAFMDFQHFNGNQTSVNLDNNYLNAFNNLPYYALSTNKSYLEMHAEHNFNGYILGKIPLLNKLNYKLVVGFKNLATENNLPYQEFSIGIDNIGYKKFRFLRVDYVRSYQGGFLNDAVIFGLSF